MFLYRYKYFFLNYWCVKLKYRFILLINMLNKVTEEFFHYDVMCYTYYTNVFDLDTDVFSKIQKFFTKEIKLFLR